MNALVPNLRSPDHPVAEMFYHRHSPRAFSDAALSEAQVMQLLEAGRWAPSASNIQPWKFVFALRGEAGFEAINAALVPFNQTWASKAAALIVFASNTTATDKEGKINVNPSAAYDVGQAAFSVALQAHLDGLIAHQMIGYDGEALAKAIGLPADHQLNAVMAVGSLGKAADLPDYMHAGETPNARRALAQSVVRGHF
jgi:nitroreductase